MFLGVFRKCSEVYSIVLRVWTVPQIVKLPGEGGGMLDLPFAVVSGKAGLCSKADKLRESVATQDGLILNS